MVSINFSTDETFICLNTQLYAINMCLSFNYGPIVDMNSRDIHIFCKQPHFPVKPRVAIEIPKIRLKVAMKYF